MRKETLVQKISISTARRFTSLSLAGTNVEDLVRFILNKQTALKKAWFKKYIGDDARDYINTAYFFEPLSNRALGKIVNLKRSDIRRRLKDKSYPFSRLNKKNREILLTLPNSWIYGSAKWLLDSRKRRNLGQV